MLVVGGYAAVRHRRAELVDVAAPRTAAARFLATEPLYRPDDGHYQFKYLPAFAPFMVPFTWVSKEVAEFTWFAVMVVMAWAFVRMSLVALPDRRRSATVLVWLTLLLTGKFLVKELALGQFNLPLALLLLGAVIAAQHGRRSSAGALVAAGVFVKPYALVLVPWLAWTLGWRPFVAFGLVLAAGLLLPAVNLRLGRQPDPVARVVSHRHRDDGTKPPDAREHLVRLDVGEVDRARALRRRVLRWRRRSPPSPRGSS